MRLPEGVVLLACTCFLLILVLAAAESGKVVGANYQMALGIFPFNVSYAFRSPIALNSSQGAQLLNLSGNPVPQTVPQVQNPSGPFASPSFLRFLPGWSLSVLGIACFVLACFLALRLKTSTRIVDFEKTLKEMQIQQRRLAQAWSYRLRNRALLRYYLLMRRACSEIGLQEGLAETPKEYIQRASSFLKVDDEYAARFADVVDRCRYGVELSGEDANNALGFMVNFTEVIRRRVNAP